MARISGPVRDSPGPKSAATGCDQRVPGPVEGPRTQRVSDGATVTGRPRRLGSRLHGTAASVRDGMTATRESVAPVGFSAVSSAAEGCRGRAFEHRRHGRPGGDDRAGAQVAAQPRDEPRHLG